MLLMLSSTRKLPVPSEGVTVGCVHGGKPTDSGCTSYKVGPAHAKVRASLCSSDAWAEEKAGGEAAV